MLSWKWRPFCLGLNVLSPKALSGTPSHSPLFSQSQQSELQDIQKPISCWHLVNSGINKITDILLAG